VHAYNILYSGSLALKYDEQLRLIIRF